MTSNGVDCLISCGGNTVKLHREILCGRSKFFRAALTGGFMVRYVQTLFAGPKHCSETSG